MKHRTVSVPLLLPKLSDQAAVHLTDILEQLLGIVEHHYGDQVQRRRRRQNTIAAGPSHVTAPLKDDPF